ncbi:hypothetical protein [Crossiella sp. CA198]|uniref:hypothetical protein n=1 Tax=Crossiella sp. CA198 TaxID=3455607 RepID=UPI003F8D50C8
MPAEYRFLYGDLLTRRILGELPATAARYTETRNAPGSISVTIPLEPGPVSGLGPESFAEGRTTLWVERDGVVLAGAIFWTTEIDLATGELTLNGEGYHSYFRRRLLRVNLSFPPTTDRAMIVKGLLDHAQDNGPNFPIWPHVSGNIGVDTSRIRPLGATSERNYLGYERHSYGQLIENLTDDLDDFSFRYVHRWDAHRATITTYVEVIAPGAAPPNLTFDLGRNCAVTSRITRDGTLLTNRADAIGEGSGAEAPIQTRIARTEGLPLLERAETFSTVSEPLTLRGKADGMLRLGAAPIIVPTLSITPDAEPALGSYGAGHTARFIADAGLLHVDARYLIGELSVDIVDGIEDVRVSLASDPDLPQTA